MESIKDRIAIVGMGCSKFGENWDQGEDDMIVAAAYEAYQDAGIEPGAIQAAWVGTLFTNPGGASIADPLKLQHLPVSRIENVCVSGLDSFRNACIAVACGMYDVALAMGFEKLRDLGLRGVPGLPMGGGEHPTFGVGNTPPSSYALPFARHCHKYGTTREHLAKIAVKNHHHGTLCPRAFIRREVTVEQVLQAPMVAWPFGVLDCCPTTDGAAAAIICRTDLARSFRHDYVLLKGMGLCVTPGRPQWVPGFDFLGWPATQKAAKRAYEEAGISNPFQEIDLAQVHDCFTLTELLSYEDLGFCPRGEGKDYVDSGAFTLEGELPVNTDGGLECFGHPTGASGLRMLYEIYKQLQCKVEPNRQVKNAQVGLVHSLGGEYPNVSAVAIVATP